jgi:hypothetical protein
MGSIPSLFLLCGAAAVIAAIGFVIVHRLVKPIDLDEHQGFLDAMLSIVGTLVSILLGLLVAAALDHYRAIEQSVDTEAANVAQVCRLSHGLPEKTQKRILGLGSRYCYLVVHEEWPAMARGEGSAKVFQTYGEIISEVVKYRPSSEGESNIHAALISAMQQIGDGRRQRILVLKSSWTEHLMPVLLMCSAIVLIFAYLYVRRGAVLHGVLICLVAVALGGNLGLVLLLGNPFSGDWKIQPKGFEFNLDVLQRMGVTPEPDKPLPEQLPEQQTDNSSPLTQ